MVLLCSEVSNESNFDTVQFTANLGIVAVGVLALVFSHLQFKRTLEAEKRREKREEIRKKLDEFYGPFLQLRKKSDILYNRFQSVFRQQDPDFSTLLYIMKGVEFIGNDRKLLEEIIRIGSICEQLVHDKAGLIDDDRLRNDILPKLTTHYLLLRLAFEGVLDKDIDRFKDHSFPVEVDQLINKRFKELQEELKLLYV